MRLYWNRGRKAACCFSWSPGEG